MSVVVRKRNCTIFKRSDSEKRMYNMTKEFNAMKQELEEMKKQLASSSQTQSSRKKKASADTEE